MRPPLTWIVLSAFLWSVPGPACSGQEPPETTLRQWEAALGQVAGYTIGQSTNGLAGLLKCEREADHTQTGRQAFEARLLAFLTSKATLDAKQFVCRQLNRIGSAASASVLAGFLENPEMADMARYALEGIPGPAVDQALLAALSQANGHLKIGIINTLGNRQSRPAVAPLLQLAEQPDEAIARSAIGALKKIGGTNTARGLTTLRPALSSTRQWLVTDALLWCADDLRRRGHSAPAESVYRACFTQDPPVPIPLRAAALRGLLLCDPAHVSVVLGLLAQADHPLHGVAADLIRHVPDPSITLQAARQLPQLPPESQVRLLLALSDRGDPEAVPAVVQAVQSSHGDVSEAALAAVGVLGGPDQVPVLMAHLNDPNPAKLSAAFDSLCRLRGPGTDARIIAALPGQAASVQRQLLDCLADRRAVSAVPALLELTERDHRSVQENAWRALGRLASPRQLPALVRLVAATGDPKVLEPAESALTKVLSQSDAPDDAAHVLVGAYDQATRTARPVLLRVAGHTGADQALELTQAALKDPQAEIQDCAVRVLADWPTPAPAPELLAIIQTTTNQTHRALAFRGYVRLAGLAEPGALSQAVNMYRQALRLANSTAERKRVLSGLSAVAHPEALGLAKSCLADEATRTEAASAMVKIAGAVGKTNPKTARPALQAVLEQCDNPGIRKQAQEALKKLP